jgi:hypothetical protein
MTLGDGGTTDEGIQQIDWPSVQAALEEAHA